jgi:hypothetical protein
MLFLNFYNKIKNSFNQTMQFGFKNKYSVLFTFYVLNKFFKQSFSKLVLTSFGLHTIYQNRYFIINSTLDLYFNTKLKIIKFYNDYYREQDFKLLSAKLYIDLKNNFDVTDYIKNNKIKRINKSLMFDLILMNKLALNYDEELRLKIHFSYKKEQYIIYYSCEELVNYKNKKIIDCIPYPMYSENILENYRKNFIVPNYVLYDNNKIYTLFNIESRDILNIKINNEENEKLINYFNMIQTPFHDFGLLYNCPVKLKWVLSENNIDINNFNSFYLKFINMYFDEKNLDLKEHIIELNKNDLENAIISERMKNIMNIDNKSFKNICNIYDFSKEKHVILDSSSDDSNSEFAIEPVVESVAEPSVEPVVESVAEPSVEPAVEPIIEFAIEPVVEFAVEPVVEPVVEFAVEPVVESAVEFAVEPVVEFAVEPVIEPVVEPVIESVVEPVVEPVVESTVEPVVEFAVEPVIEHGIEPVVEPTVEPVVESV